MMEKGSKRGIVLSENDIKNYQSLGAYFTKQSEKYNKKNMIEAKEYFDMSTSTSNINAGNEVDKDMMKRYDKNNSLVSDSQQSFDRETYSYRKLISYPVREPITEKIKECDNEKGQAPLINKTKHGDKNIMSATSEEYDSDTFVRYKTIDQKEEVTKCFNNMLKDFMENDAGTFRQYAGVPSKDFVLDTAMRYNSSTIEMRNLHSPCLVKYEKMSKEQKQKYFPSTEGNSEKSLSFDYFVPGHTNIRNKNNPVKGGQTTLKEIRNFSKENANKNPIQNIKQGNTFHKKIENSVKEGILWQQTNNPFFR